ncbi:hypothetical protein BMD93_24370, partial [Klebsiella pneumoniae]
GTVCVVGKMRDLILQLSKSSIYSTKPPSGRRARAVECDACAADQYRRARAVPAGRATAVCHPDHG